MKRLIQKPGLSVPVIILALLALVFAVSWAPVYAAPMPAQAATPMMTPNYNSGGVVVTAVVPNTGTNTTISNFFFVPAWLLVIIVLAIIIIVLLIALLARGPRRPTL